MLMRHFAWLLVPLAVSAAEARAPVRPPSISYETGACFGRCPIYRVTVSADGRGTFEGRRFTAVEGVRNFRLTRAQYEAFAARLAPYRPRGSEEINHGHPRCRRVATDHPSVSISWMGRRAADRLSFYFGCRDPANAAMARTLAEAPGLLPIGDFIGARR